MGYQAGNGCAAIDRAQPAGFVAVHQDLVADLVAPLDAEGDRAVVQFFCNVVSRFQGLDVGVDQLFLALELVADELLEHVHVHVEQSGERADIHDVAEELALRGRRYSARGNSP